MVTLDVELMTRNTTKAEVNKKILKLQKLFYELTIAQQEFEGSFAAVTRYPGGGVTALKIENVKRSEEEQEDSFVHVCTILKHDLPVCLYSIVPEPDKEDDVEL